MPHNNLDTISIDKACHHLADPKFALTFLKGYFSNAANNSPRPFLPERLYIACVDSRAAPDTIFKEASWESMSHRNVGGIVRAFEEQRDEHPVATLATIEYALHKKVKHIILMGHTLCGGVKAHLTGDAPEVIKAWMKDASNVEKGEKCDAELREGERDCLRQSFNNLMEYPGIKEAINEGNLAITHLLDNLEHGELEIVVEGSINHKAIGDLVKRYKKFRKNAYNKEHGCMHDLVKNDQHPKALIISGINHSPSSSFGLEVGDALSYRHISGAVAPFDNTWEEKNVAPYGLAATVEFAVGIKKVETIVIKMHVDTFLDEYIAGELPPRSTAWLEYCVPTLSAMKERGATSEELREECMFSSIAALKKYPGVQEGIDNSTLSILPIIEKRDEGELMLADPTTRKLFTIEQQESVPA